MSVLTSPLSVVSRFIQNELDDATTPQRMAYYVWLLNDTLWPDGSLDTSPTRTPSAQQRDVTRKQARRCLYEFFPSKFQFAFCILTNANLVI